MLVARALPAKNFCIKTRKISVAIPLICIYFYTISAQKTALNQRFLCLPMKTCSLPGPQKLPAMPKICSQSPDLNKSYTKNHL